MPDTSLQIESTDFLTLLEDPVRQICLDLVADESSSDASSPAARVDRFEIALRTAALQLLGSNSVTALQELWKRVVLAVSHVLYFAEQQQEEDTAAAAASESNSSMINERYTSLNSVSSHLRKLPVILLEDILDTLSLSNGYTFWKACIPGSRLFEPLLWHPISAAKQPPCWLPFLKSANKFLRRLQAQENLLLVENNGDDTTTGNVAAAAVLQILSQVYPLTEKSATRVWGSHNADHMTELESETEFETEQQSKKDDPASKPLATADLPKRVAAAVADYSFYETFWT